MQSVARRKQEIFSNINNPKIFFWDDVKRTYIYFVIFALVYKPINNLDTHIKINTDSLLNQLPYSKLY